MPREFEWIEKLATRFGTTGRGLKVGIGSDCAVLRTFKGRPLVTTDMQVEGVHFDPRYITWRDTGYRAVTTGLSDLAAGGVDPAGPFLAFLSIAIPKNAKEKNLDELVDGFEEAFNEFRVTFAGGDTVATPGPLVLNFTFIGSSPRPLTRAGAHPGDRVYVAGTLGGAAAGIRLLKEGRAAAADEPLLLAYRRPKPLLPLGAAIARLGATACADVSDGLLADAKHIAEQSRLAMRIDLDKIPIRPRLRVHKGFSGEERLRLAATGGDDYALVFTAPGIGRESLEIISAESGCPVVEIGWCVQGPPGEIECLFKGKKRTFDFLGYEHGKTKNQ